MLFSQSYTVIGQEYIRDLTQRKRPWDSLLSRINHVLSWQYSRRTMLKKPLLPLRRRVTQSAIAVKASFYVFVRLKVASNSDTDRFEAESLFAYGSVAAPGDIRPGAAPLVLPSFIHEFKGASSIDRPAACVDTYYIFGARRDSIEKCTCYT